MLYSIGDLSDILGITTSAIRFLESKDIIHPHKDPAGYRLYDLQDIFRLLSYNKYKNMKIPLKEISRQFSGAENDRHLIYSRIKAASQEAQRKAQYYADLVCSIDEYLDDIESIDRLLNRYEFERSPEWLFLSDSETGWLSANRHQRGIIRPWVDAMPLVHLSAISQYPSRTSQLGYLIRAEKANQRQLPCNDTVQRIGGLPSLHTIRIAKQDFPADPNEVFGVPLLYAESRGFHIAGPMVANIILVETAPDTMKVYVDLWVPIQ